jgi:hypothetical protein
MKDAIEVSMVFHEGNRMMAVPKQSAPVQDSTCNENLRAQDKAYPRTCKKCGKGPCIGAPKQPPSQPAPVQEPVAYDKTEMNCFVQELYDKKMCEGKHGHYETMFYCVHQAIKRVTPPAAQPAVPDAITDDSESPEYRTGWNDCRQAMMEMMK